MEATERDRQEQEFAAQGDAESAAENVYSPSEYERIKLKPLMPAILAIGGVKQTRGYVIARELKGLNQAQNLDELKDVLLDATNALMALDIFEAVEFTLDDEPLQREVLVAAMIAWTSPDMLQTSQPVACICMHVPLPRPWPVAAGEHAQHHHTVKLAGTAHGLSCWAWPLPKPKADSEPDPHALAP